MMKVKNFNKLIKKIPRKKRSLIKISNKFVFQKKSMTIYYMIQIFYSNENRD